MNTFKIVAVAMLLLLLYTCKEAPQSESKTSTTVETKELFRPYFHFTPDSMWMNDPNGMYYKDGIYHLFYQYYPDSTVWGPMHWGHASSHDLMQWAHHPIALFPDSLGYIFSGSAVVDHKNTSGFGNATNGPIVAFFTHHDAKMEKSGSTVFQNQSLAWSLDGMNWQKYENNPVITNPGIKDFRDPKVIWHEDTKKWVLVLAAYDKVMLYTSTDLKKWTYSSSFGIDGDERLWECPDLFPMETEEGTKWVLIVSIQKEAPSGGTGTSYFVGDFDGTAFKADSKAQKWLDYGTDNYAFVTWDNAPNNSRVGIGWMSNWLYAQQVPTKTWRSAMTTPRELSLKKTAHGYLLHSLPPKTVDNYFELDKEMKNISIPTDTILYAQAAGLAPLQATFAFKKPENGIIEVRFSNDESFVSVGYDVESSSYFCDRTHAGLDEFYDGFAAYYTAPDLSSSETIGFKILLDAASIELFSEDGSTNMTHILFPTSPYTQIEIRTYSSAIELSSCSIYTYSKKDLKKENF